MNEKWNEQYAYYESMKKKGRRDVLARCIDTIGEGIEDGWEIYSVIFRFDEIGGNRRRRLNRMKVAVTASTPRLEAGGTTLDCTTNDGGDAHSARWPAGKNRRRLRGFYHSEPLCGGLWP